jgi:hypothetical protein
MDFAAVNYNVTSRDSSEGAVFSERIVTTT